MTDVEQSVYENLLSVSFVWPGITPHNVWDTPYDFWCMYVQHAEDFMRLRVPTAM